MTSPLRIYEPHELGEDGYPLAWHDMGGGQGIKHLVRAEADNRCVRCGHPFIVGESGEFEDTGEGIDMTAETMEMFTMEDLAGLARSNTVRVHWSACDELCTHGGPVRWRSTFTGEWHRRDDSPSVKDVEFMLREVSAVQAAWRILTVHHLNGRKFDCRWWNLASLCQRCHLYIQRKVQMERVYPFEHSEWFKPYAAGWYAYAYRGQDLARVEVSEQLDELLALEQMA